MKRVFAVSAVFAVAVFALNGFITRASKQDSFWNDAAQDGMAEVMLGHLALQKSSNEQVKSFAQQLVADHTAASDEMKSLAASRNVTLPADVSAKQKSAIDKLSDMSGAEFDRAFIKQMVKDHEGAVKLFQKESDKGADADVKAFAAKTLPTLRNHLQTARTMNDGMKNTKSGGSSNGNMNMNSNVNADRR